MCDKEVLPFGTATLLFSIIMMVPGILGAKQRYSTVLKARDCDAACQKFVARNSSYLPFQFVLNQSQYRDFNVQGDRFKAELYDQTGAEINRRNFTRFFFNDELGIGATCASKDETDTNANDWELKTYDLIARDFYLTALPEGFNYTIEGCESVMQDGNAITQDPANPSKYAVVPDVDGCRIVLADCTADKVTISFCPYPDPTKKAKKANYYSQYVYKLKESDYVPQTVRIDPESTYYAKWANQIMVAGWVFFCVMFTFMLCCCGGYICENGCRDCCDDLCSSFNDIGSCD